jgi:hypothetical protein
LGCKQCLLILGTIEELKLGLDESQWSASNGSLASVKVGGWVAKNST